MSGASSRSGIVSSRSGGSAREPERVSAAALAAEARQPNSAEHPPPNGDGSVDRAKEVLLARIKKRQAIEDEERAVLAGARGPPGDKIKRRSKRSFPEQVDHAADESDPVAAGLAAVRDSLRLARDVIEKRSREEEALLKSEQSRLAAHQGAGALHDHAGVLRDATLLCSKAESKLNELEQVFGKALEELKATHCQEVEHAMGVAEKLKGWYEEVDEELQYRDEVSEEFLRARKSPMLDEVREYGRKLFADLEAVFVAVDEHGEHARKGELLLNREEAIVGQVDEFIGELEETLTEHWSTSLRESYGAFAREKVGPHPIRDNQDYLTASRHIRDLHAEHLALIPLSRDLLDIEKDLFSIIAEEGSVVAGAALDPGGAAGAGGAAAGGASASASAESRVQSEGSTSSADHRAGDSDSRFVDPDVVLRRKKMELVDGMKAQITDNYELLSGKLEALLQYVKNKIATTPSGDRGDSEEKALRHYADAKAKMVGIFHLRDEHLQLVEELRDLLDEKLMQRQKVLLPKQAQATLMRHLRKASGGLFEKMRGFQDEYVSMQKWVDARYKQRHRDLVTHVSHLEKKLELLHANRAHKAHFQRCLSDNFLRYPFETQTTYLAVMARMTELEMHLQHIVDKGFPELAVDDEYSEKLLVGNLKRKELLRILADRVHELEDEKILNKIAFRTSIVGDSLKPSTDNPHGVLFSVHDDARHDLVGGTSDQDDGGIFPRGQQGKNKNKKFDISSHDEDFTERRKLEKMKHENFVQLVSEKIDAKIDELKKVGFLRGTSHDDAQLLNPDDLDLVSVADTEDSMVQLRLIQKRTVEKVKKEVEERQKMEGAATSLGGKRSREKALADRRAAGAGNCNQLPGGLPTFGTAENLHSMLDWDLDAQRPGATSSAQRRKIDLTDYERDLKIGDALLDDFLMDEEGEFDDASDLFDTASNASSAASSVAIRKPSLKMKAKVEERGTGNKSKKTTKTATGAATNNRRSTNASRSKLGAVPEEAGAPPPTGGADMLDDMSIRSADSQEVRSFKARPAAETKSKFLRSEIRRSEAMQRDVLRDFEEEKSSDFEEANSLASLSYAADRANRKTGGAQMGSRMTNQQTAAFLKDLKEAQYTDRAPASSSSRAKLDRSSLVDEEGDPDSETPAGPDGRPAPQQVFAFFPERSSVDSSKVSSVGGSIIRASAPAILSTVSLKSPIDFSQRLPSFDPGSFPHPADDDHAGNRKLTRKSLTHLQRVFDKISVADNLESDMLDVALPKIEEAHHILDLIRRLSSNTSMVNMTQHDGHLFRPAGAGHDVHLEHPHPDAVIDSAQSRISALTVQLSQILNLFADCWQLLDIDTTKTHHVLRELYAAFHREHERSEKRLHTAMSHVYKRNVFDRLISYVDESFFLWRTRVLKRREAKYLRENLALKLDNCRTALSKDLYFTNWRMNCQAQNSAIKLLNYYATKRFAVQRNWYLVALAFEQWTGYWRKAAYRRSFHDLANSGKLEADSWKKLCEEITDDRNNLASKYAYLQDLLSTEMSSAGGNYNNAPGAGHEDQHGGNDGDGTVVTSAASPSTGDVHILPSADAPIGSVAEGMALLNLVRKKQKSLTRSSDHGAGPDHYGAAVGDVPEGPPGAPGSDWMGGAADRSSLQDADAGGDSPAVLPRGTYAGTPSSGGISLKGRARGGRGSVALGTSTSRGANSSGSSLTNSGAVIPATASTSAAAAAHHLRRSAADSAMSVSIEPGAGGGTATDSKAELDEKNEADLEVLLESYLAQASSAGAAGNGGVIREYIRQLKSGRLTLNDLPGTLRQHLEKHMPASVLKKIIAKGLGQKSGLPLRTTAGGSVSGGPSSPSTNLRATGTSLGEDGLVREVFHRGHARHSTSGKATKKVGAAAEGERGGEDALFGEDDEEDNFDVGGDAAGVEKSNADLNKTKAIADVANDHAVRARSFLRPTAEVSQISAIKAAARKTEKADLLGVGARGGAGGEDGTSTSNDRGRRGLLTSGSSAAEDSDELDIFTEQMGMGTTAPAATASTSEKAHAHTELLQLAQKQGGVLLELLRFWKALQIYREIYVVFYGNHHRMARIEEHFKSGRQPSILPGVYGMLVKDVTPASVSNSSSTSDVNADHVILIPKGHAVYVEEVVTRDVEQLDVVTGVRTKRKQQVVSLSHLHPASNELSENLETTLESLHDALMDIQFHADGTRPLVFEQFDNKKTHPTSTKMFNERESKTGGGERNENVRTIERHLRELQNLVHGYARDGYVVQHSDWERDPMQSKSTKWSKLQQLLTFAVGPLALAPRSRSGNVKGMLKTSSNADPAAGEDEQLPLLATTAMDILERAAEHAAVVSDLFVGYAEGETGRKDSLETRRLYLEHLQQTSPEFLFHVQDLIIILRSAAHACALGKTEEFVSNPVLYQKLQEAHAADAVAVARGGAAAAGGGAPRAGEQQQQQSPGGRGGLTRTTAGGSSSPAAAAVAKRMNKILSSGGANAQAVAQTAVDPPSDVFPEVFLLVEVLNSTPAHVKHTALRYVIETASSFYHDHSRSKYAAFLPGTTATTATPLSHHAGKNDPTPDTHEAVLVHAYGLVSHHFRKAVDLELQPLLSGAGGDSSLFPKGKGNNVGNDGKMILSSSYGQRVPNVGREKAGPDDMEDGEQEVIARLGLGEKCW
eukprot:g14890.t1